MAMQGGQTEVGASELNVQLGKSRAFSNVKTLVRINDQMHHVLVTAPSCSVGNVCEQRRVNIYIAIQVSKDFLMVVCERADEVWELSKDMADGVSLYALQKALDDHHGLRDDLKHCEKKQPN